MQRWIITIVPREAKKDVVLRPTAPRARAMAAEDFR
jgi:hypothetical protein